jgi:hypothetical protein
LHGSAIITLPKLMQSAMVDIWSGNIALPDGDIIKGKNAI